VTVLRGSVALVTGASRGIGRAVAEELSRRGARVGLLARSEGELAEAAGRLGEGAAFAAADVADEAAVWRAVESLEGELGPPDILVNNAGIGAYAAVLEAPPESFERLMRVNYQGTVHATRAVLAGMVSRRRGHIVNVASVAGRLGAPFEAAYSASKFAVVGFTESLAAEVRPLGVSVSLVNPGPVDTHFTEARGVPFQRRFPRPLRPEVVARAITASIEDDIFERTLPRWLRTGTVARAVAPQLYRRGLVRASRKESAALGRRH
jgi:3-oxoacyl-[acyl-carrier protein] reductase